MLISVLGLVRSQIGASCGHEEHRIRLTNADNGRTVVVRAGDAFDVALEVPVGPFYYGTPVVSSESVRGNVPLAVEKRS